MIYATLQKNDNDFIAKKEDFDDVPIDFVDEFSHDKSLYPYLHINKLKLENIVTDRCQKVLDKAGRVVDGISHGRVVLKGDGVYYKIFDDDYCRKDNFIKA